MKEDNSNSLNFILAIVLSGVILLGWHYFFDRPKPAKAVAQQNLEMQARQSNSHTFDNKENKVKDGELCLDAPRVKIESNHLNGTLSLRGGRLDDLYLTDYKNSVDSESGLVHLLSPSGNKESYFVEFGWISDGTLETPGSNSLWKTEDHVIGARSAAKLSWTNNTGDLFALRVSIDDNYMFFVEQSFTNNSSSTVHITAYGLANKVVVIDKSNNSSILHQGAIGSINGSLEEYSYDKLKDEKSKKFTDEKIDWVGISDKYWLVAFIPDHEALRGVNFQFSDQKDLDKVQVDFITNKISVQAGQTITLRHKLFAGAKQVKLLDKYSKEYNIKLFDRAIDFGWLYMITKPLFYVLTFCYSLVGNFGLSILIVTVFIKILMFGISNRSYRSMAKLKEVQPKIEQLKQQYSNDKVKFNEKILELYKVEKINPFSSILGLLVQIPVFFAIYKVLYVTIEMRHAPFFGWIKDLSSTDPTNIFNLFGLLPIEVPSFLHIGAWPIIMSISMYLQQRMSPAPSDPAQAQVMKFLPLIFLFMFSGFPVGLLIYWTWSNILSMLQQRFFAHK